MSRRLFLVGAKASAPPVAAPPTPDAVLVTAGTGACVVRIVSRFADGSRPLTLEVDRGLLSDDELESLIGWARRFAERRDPARRNALAPV